MTVGAAFRIPAALVPFCDRLQLSEKLATLHLPTVEHFCSILKSEREHCEPTRIAKIEGMAGIARGLAYRLYTLRERKGWAEEAGYYNSLVVAWPSMASEAFEPIGS